MKKIKILTVLGTRPEAIKMAPLINELNSNKNVIHKQIITGQHRKMLDQVIRIFGLKPDYDLNIMLRSQSIHTILSKCITGLGKIYEQEKPDLILVHGDTATTMAAAIAGYYSKIKVGHVESGLRSFDRYNPFPEEENRRVTDVLSSYHFAPTEGNKKNLLKENIDPENIFVTGNTGIDALFFVLEKHIKPDHQTLLKIPDDKRVVLITAHRRENLGEPIKEICKGLLKLSKDFADTLFIYPVHLNPDVKTPVHSIISKQRNFLLIPPLSYPDMVWLLDRSYLCFTDSGGIQEEAPALGKPVLVIRKVTERPEAVHSGTVKVIGTDQDEIYKWGKKLLKDSKTYKKFSHSVNPYGDGKASRRIVRFIEYAFGYRKNRPEEWII